MSRRIRQAGPADNAPIGPIALSDARSLGGEEVLPTETAGFRFAKWYGDVVAEDGSAAIVYGARLELLGLHLDWSSRLEVAHDGARRERSSFSSRAVVEPGAGAVRWSEPALGLDGSWSGGRHLRETLLSRPDGEVHWEVPAAAADARLRIDYDALVGRGYVERIVLTLPPWRLGLRRLLWGRFVGSSRSLVWISWEGDEPLALAFLDGTRRADVRFGPDLLPLFPGRARLTAGPLRTLRDAPIAGRLAGVLLPPALPGRILRGIERKWLASARLDSPEGEDEGSLLFEEVVWP